MKSSAEKKVSKGDKYFEAVGRRKTAVARVRLSKGTGKFSVNEKEIDKYFPTLSLRQRVTAPLDKLDLGSKFSGTLKISGGGPKAQAEAARHGIARAIIKAEPDHKKALRTFGFLTRDSRMVERKKYGLRKARRAPQWAKR